MAQLRDRTGESLDAEWSEFDFDGGDLGRVTGAARGRFHPLKGERAGEFAVSVSGNWRLTFRFDGEDATDVNLEDYH